MFLQEIASEIISRHGNNLARTAVVFPNKRASLWMNDQLTSAAGAPVFAPQYFSISDLFQRHSSLVPADHIQLVSLLHKSYCKVTRSNETLDRFYAWGEILLSDFDNVDKSLADAKQLFHNVTNIHEMDSIDYLSDHQKQMLEHFFAAFSSDHGSRLQQKFISLWNNLLGIYTDFRESLFALGIAYEGMLYRDVVERVDGDAFSLDSYYAVGFNVLLPVEQRLFGIIGNKLHRRDDVADITLVNKDAKITIAQSLTDDLQARYVNQWLTENNRIADGRRTAIVLCDESLLPAVTYCLPEDVGPVNITAGYPLAETQPALYIATLLEMFTEGLTRDLRGFRTSFMRNVTSHPMHSLYTEKHPEPLSPALINCNNANVATAPTTAGILAFTVEAITTIATALNSGKPSQSSAAALLSESAFRVYNIVVRLNSLYEQGYLDIDPLTLARLYRQIILTATIPFHGEPAKGVQIMGLLETRNLDFDHILMLSCNEGVMPKGSSDTSVIPYNIKKAFALNTSDDRTSIFAYYFYRLLKRCKDITLVYNASGSDTSPGEMSRFLLSLLVNNPEQISRISLQTQFHAHTKQPQPQDKLPEELHDYIERRKEKGVSPSAINTYMSCEKRFYYQYFRQLSEEHDEDDTIDAASFGIFFHAAAEEFYRPLIGRQITSAALHHYIENDRLLDPFIDTALQKTKDELYGEGNNIDSGGMELLLKSIVKQYLKRLLKNDALNAPFSVVSLEQDYHTQYTINTPEGEITLNIGGNVDRLDRVTGSTGRDTLRVVDYKTGPDHTKTSIKTVADMFDDKIKGAGYYRQTCLYSLALANDCQTNPDHLPVAPALYYIRNKDVGGDEYHNPMLTLDGQPIDNIATIKAEYEEHLMDVLKEIFNKSTFDVAEDQSVCAYCPFVEMCRKA